MTTMELLENTLDGLVNCQEFKNAWHRLQPKTLKAIEQARELLELLHQIDSSLLNPPDEKH